MNRILKCSFFVLFCVVNFVLGSDDSSISKDEMMALNRDGFGRQNQEDDFTNGFFAAWPLVLFILAGFYYFLNFYLKFNLKILIK